MRAGPKLMSAVALLALGGCATVFKGTTQDILVDSDPQGANCELTRGGAILGQVNPTPGKFKATRSKDPILIACNKDGFGTGQATLESTFNGATFGNIIAGGLIGVAVDASTGANYTYPEQVTVTLPPPGDSAVPPSAPPPPDPPPPPPKPPGS